MFVIRTITPCCWDRVRRRTMTGALLVSMLSIMGAGNGIICVIAPSQSLVVCALTHVYMRFVYAHARARVCAPTHVYMRFCVRTRTCACVYEHACVHMCVCVCVRMHVMHNHNPFKPLVTPNTNTVHVNEMQGKGSLLLSPTAVCRVLPVLTPAGDCTYASK